VHNVYFLYKENKKYLKLYSLSVIKMVKIRIVLIFMALLFIKIRCLTVNNKCLKFEAIKDFEYPPFIKWKMHSHLESVEKSIIHPLKFPIDKSFDCARFIIKKGDNEDTRYTLYLINAKSGSNKFIIPIIKFGKISNEDHNYMLSYNTIFDGECNKRIITEMQLVAAKNNYYLVYWICINLNNYLMEQSMQAALILVNEKMILQNEDKEYIMRLLNKTSQELILSKNNQESICDTKIEDLFAYNCDWNYDEIINEPLLVEEHKNNYALRNFFVIIFVLILFLVLIEDYLS